MLMGTSFSPSYSDIIDECNENRLPAYHTKNALSKDVI